MLGPNGSGKTTLIRVLALALAPSAGNLEVNGVSTTRDARAARRAIGLVGHRTGLYEDLTPRENLRFYARLYGVSAAEQRIGEVLGELGLTRVADQTVRTLSRGTQQRAAVARAILHDPQVLLLDEPETGLDADAQEGLAALIGRWTELGRAVLVATHRLDWAGRLADRALVLKEGAIQAELRPKGEGLAQAYLQALGADV